MMLVATVTSTPFAQATKLDYVCICIHLTGAVMLFAGYGITEVYALGCCCVRQAEATSKSISVLERRVRMFCLLTLAFWYVLFGIIMVLLMLPLEQYGGHNDVWETKLVTTEIGNQMPVVVLADTASGFVLYLKIGCYVSEVICGLCLIGSMLTIWYFCEERHSDLKDELTSVAGLGPNAETTA